MPKGASKTFEELEKCRSDLEESRLAYAELKAKYADLEAAHSEVCNDYMVVRESLEYEGEDPDKVLEEFAQLKENEKHKLRRKFAAEVLNNLKFIEPKKESGLPKLAELSSFLEKKGLSVFVARMKGREILARSAIDDLNTMFKEMIPFVLSTYVDAKRLADLESDKLIEDELKAHSTELTMQVRALEAKLAKKSTPEEAFVPMQKESLRLKSMCKALEAKNLELNNQIAELQVALKAKESAQKVREIGAMQSKAETQALKRQLSQVLSEKERHKIAETALLAESAEQKTRIDALLKALEAKDEEMASFKFFAENQLMSHQLKIAGLQSQIEALEPLVKFYRERAIWNPVMTAKPGLSALVVTPGGQVSAQKASATTPPGYW